MFAQIDIIALSRNQLNFFPPKDLEFCLNGMDDCDESADCTDIKDGFTCECHDEFQDMQPDLPGRICGN